ncbi:hypothetical protein JHL21_08790 [Devosia sp. WQ 349]|uniref:hypothetical protein n=1 Tax=Devosia sp. WQ 349K1 TaxID=2800329 RepID=UPI0019032A49|nr:hypothetical protein [Devosia sp. WQ 349K1]MBK1794601.1 hypothetical protein [Devosia sp. WQ 349K1]
MELALILLVVLIGVSAILYAGWYPQKDRKKAPVAAPEAPPADVAPAEAPSEPQP